MSEDDWDFKAEPVYWSVTIRDTRGTGRFYTYTVEANNPDDAYKKAYRMRGKDAQNHYAEVLCVKQQAT